MKTGGKRKSCGITETGEHAQLPRSLVHPEDQSLRFVLSHHRCGISGPFGMTLEEKLKRKGR
jgi:hypothetical protein